MATNGAASSIVCLSNPTAIACVARDGSKFTRRVRKKIIDKNTIKIFAENTPLCWVFAKAGINTCVKAPSAKILRKRFGSLKAIKNMSLYMFAPRTDAVNKSLKNPRIRDIKIPKLFVKMALNMGFFCLRYWFYKILTKV